MNPPDPGPSKRTQFALALGTFISILTLSAAFVIDSFTKGC